MPSVASRLIVFALVAFALCAAARPAAGQTRSGSGRVYVSASFLGDIKRFAGDPEEPVFDGESLGAGITVGTALAPRWDLQLGVDVPQFTTTSRERLVTLLRRIGLPVFDPATCTPELMTRALEASWQRRGRKLHLVVPTGIGKADFVERLEDVPADVLRGALDALAHSGGTS